MQDSSTSIDSLWYVDSGGSRHMTGCRTLLKDFNIHGGGDISFGNNSKGKVLGSGVVQAGKVRFENVNLIDNLKFNLLSVSQMSDKGYGSFFTKDCCRIVGPEMVKEMEKILQNGKIHFTAQRSGNVYVADLSKSSQRTATCLFTTASNKETELWHRRLGHTNLQTITTISNHCLVRGLPQKSFQNHEHCVSCLKGKQHKSSYKSIEESKSTKCLQLLHMDLFGPVQIMSLTKKRYCLVIIDDFSRYSWTKFLHSKDETAKIVQDFVIQVEKQFDLQVKVFRSDNGTEFRNRELDAFCVSKGIVRQYSIPRTPEQNGVVERKNRTLIEAARTMLADSGLPLIFWAEAVNTACYVQNRVLINPRHQKTAYELLFKIKPLISYFKVFGCPCFILNLKDSISKFAAKVDSGYFLGYSSTAKAYKVFNTRTKTVEETLNVKFNELSALKISANPAELFDLDKFTFENTAAKTNHAGTSSSSFTPCASQDQEFGYEFVNPLHTAVDTKTSSPGVQNITQSQTTDTTDVLQRTATVVTPSTSCSQTVDRSSTVGDLPPFPQWLQSDESTVVTQDVQNLQPSPTNAIVPYKGNLYYHRSHPHDQIIGNIEDGVITRSQAKHICLFAGFLSLHQPTKYQEALRDNSWVEAMQEELLQFKLQEVWSLVPLPSGKSPIGTKWVFKNKTDERGIVVKNKARLVALGYRQEEGIDYDETFAPVARLEAIRLFLAFAVNHKIKVYQMDIKSAFLYGPIQEEVYVCQPPGFEDPFYPDHVYKLNKALYGLKQAPRAWYDTLSSFLISNKFKRGNIDKTLFLKWKGKDLMIIQIYVDDIIFGSTCQNMCEEFRTLMTSKFKMSAMGELQCFLGLQVNQMKNGTFIHQTKYIKDLLTKFDMNDCKPCSTPMATNKLVMSEDKDELIDQTLYRSMIGSLLYLTASRPDIMFATCVCARSQSAPKMSNLIAVKRIFRYIKGAQTLGIWYPANGNVELSGFTDSDFAGCNVTRKSTSGGCQFLGNCLVSWQSKKQAAVSTSTAEAEYIAAASCTAQLLWLQNQLLDFGIVALKTPLMLDSQAAENIIKNPVSHSTTKHIDIRHHFVRDCYEKGLISLHHVPTTDQLADVLTKALDTATFEGLIARIGMLNLE